jgi:hypothetical protein
MMVQGRQTREAAEQDQRNGHHDGNASLGLQERIALREL